MGNNNNDKSMLDKAFGLFSSSVKMVLMLFGLVVVASIVLAFIAVGEVSQNVSGNNSDTKVIQTAAAPLNVQATITQAKITSDGYNEVLSMKFQFKNNYSKPIAAIKGNIGLYDNFNKQLSNAEFVEYKLSLAPGAAVEKKLSMDLNPFISEHQDIKNATEGGQIKFLIEPKYVSFSDGTTVEK
ncbi:hypothetical protein [Stagnimonas aquatica]|uniref:hypothetical protein n=1 Tax=Stagnimonas aquatica TaxID=2689987 RepID=UPI0011CD5EF9|nr:hypothetical protein [Stagnimonas aquatica]